MNTNNDEFLYDEDDAVKYIQNYLPQEMKGRFSNDDILYIIDLIHDYYESNGYFDDYAENEDMEVDIDETELIYYVIKHASKDGVGKFTEDEITFIVQGEFCYCEEISLFDKKEE